MKAIMISDKPKWCALMMNGKKKVEVRKANVGKAIQKLIDEQGFADIYVYCTKDEELYKFSWNKTWWYENFKHFTDMGCDQAHAIDSDNLNGKVLFKFRCYKVEKIKLPYTLFGTNEWVKCEAQRTLQTETLDEKDLLKLSCLKDIDFYTYLNFKNSPNNVGCAIHISDLEIFDRPKELSEFKVKKTYICKNCPPKYQYGVCLKDCTETLSLTKAPQNFCYVEVLL